MDNPLDSDGLPERPTGQPAPKPAPDGAAETPIAERAREPKGHGGGRPPKKRVNVWLYIGIVAAVLVVAGAGAFYVATQMRLPEQVKTGPAAESQGPLKSFATGSISNMVTYAQPKPVEDIPFVDRDRKPLKLSDFKGQVVVLNVWATWCAPCRYEMPTLADLQRNNVGKGVKVVALSVDEESKFNDVKSFIDVQEPLEVYVDTSFAAPSKLNVVGMPATIILDKQGRAVARLDGEASWNTPEVQALMDKLLAE